MPVTAKLSRKFYERLGDEIAAELVDWFNAVDATYRADLERLNELNFQRFDAKVEKRFAEFETRFSEFQVKIEKRFAEADTKIEKQFAEFEIRIERRFAELRVEFHKDLATVRADLIKWAFVFWMPTALAVLGLYFR